MKGDTPLLQLLGAGGFGAVLGWYLFFLNRYRAGEVALGDLVTVVGAIGGAAILALFPSESDLFGAYGIGLAIGFFGYFLVLVGLVARSDSFGIEWFLDGRRKKPRPDEVIPEHTAQTVRAMDERGDAI
ncbi:MAG TPA: hypothetical protein VM184_01850 [Gaiellaceae bacterium]|nr:hypothetical protein [Gaiellaceae bacterium]